MNDSYSYEAFGHGGDYTGEYLDFSVNVSPFGVPASVRDALRDVAEHGDLTAYPDPYCKELREQIAEHFGLTADMVLCGNGAVELIYRSVYYRMPRTALIVEPTFSEYEKALREVGCDVRKYYLEETPGGGGAICAGSFGISPDFLNALTPDLDMVFFCSPNNPTGRSLPEETILDTLNICLENRTLVFWDACFSEFCDLEDGADRQEKADAFLLSCIRDFPNLLVLKSLTKTYAIPGLRLGYLLCSDTGFVERISGFGPPWSVSSAAQKAGIAALRDTEYLERVQRYVSDEKLRVWLALLQMGCPCRRGDGNYLLLRTDFTDLPERLKKRGILVRDCSNFDGLDEHYIRVSIRTRREDDRLLDALYYELTGGGET